MLPFRSRCVSVSVTRSYELTADGAAVYNFLSHVFFLSWVNRWFMSSLWSLVPNALGQRGLTCAPIGTGIPHNFLDFGYFRFKMGMSRPLQPIVSTARRLPQVVGHLSLAVIFQLLGMESKKYFQAVSFSKVSTGAVII
jgi:hypothetical protein